MKLKNEFRVAVPLERVWETLLDIERVAGFLPGATIEPTGEEGVFAGAMKVKLGPMVVQYQGTARLGTVDEAGHTADIEVEAKELRGQGTAAAVIRNTLVAENGGTRVIAETDLNITGRQAQFGRGIMQDVAGRMLGDFAKRFEQHLLAGDGTGERGGPAASGGPAPGAGPADGGEDALDLGSVFAGIVTPQRTAAGLGAALAATLVVGMLRHRRRRITVSFSRSW